MPPAIPYNATTAPAWLRCSPSYLYSSSPPPTRLEACQERLIAVMDKSSQLSVKKDRFTPERQEEMREIYGTLMEYQEQLIKLKERDPEQTVRNLKWVTLGVSAAIGATIEYKLAATMANLFSEGTWPTLLLSGLTAIMVAASDLMELRDRGSEQIARNFKSGTLVNAVIAGALVHKSTATIAYQFSERTWLALLLSGLMGIKSARSGTQPLNEFIFAVMQFSDSDIPSGQLRMINIESDLTRMEGRIETASQNIRGTSSSPALPSSHSYGITNRTNIVNHLNEYEARIRPLLQEAEGILESLGPVPPWEQYMSNLPPALAGCLLSCARELAKMDGAVIKHLRIAFAVSLIAPYFLMSEDSEHKNKVNAALMLFIVIPFVAIQLGHQTIERNDWLSLRNIVEKLVLTLNSAKDEAESGMQRLPLPSLDVVLSSKEKLKTLKKRMETSTRAIAPEGISFFTRIETLLQLTEDFCKNPRNPLPLLQFEPHNYNPRRVLISEIKTDLAPI